jgi:hypothetical protein
MIKNGRVEIGKTPANKSGKPCRKIEDAEPLDAGDKPKNKLKKWAKMLNPLGSKKTKSQG